MTNSLAKKNALLFLSHCFQRNILEFNETADLLFNTGCVIPGFIRWNSGHPIEMYQKKEQKRKTKWKNKRRDLKKVDPLLDPGEFKPMRDPFPDNVDIQTAGYIVATRSFYSPPGRTKKDRKDPPKAKSLVIQMQLFSKDYVL